MNSRERVVRTLLHQPVDRLPREPWMLPGIAMHRAGEKAAFDREFPSDITDPGAGYAPGKRCKGTPNVVGQYTDAWGCTFHVKEDGVIGEVKQALFANDYEGLEDYKAPWELLEGIDRKAIALKCACRHRNPPL